MRRLLPTLLVRCAARGPCGPSGGPHVAAALAPRALATAPAPPSAPPCWSCGSDDAGTPSTSAPAAASLICGSCRAVRPPGEGGNYFSLLGVPRSYDVDAADLDRRYKALQTLLHPDKHAAAGDAASAAADAASAAVNAAYATLRCPLARAVYMLHGTADPPDAESHTLTDPDLLADVMEAREAVADAEPGGAALAALRADYARRADALAATLSAAFGAGDEAAARDAVTRLRYVTRIMQAATDKM